MKIELHLPRGFDAEVSYDEISRVITIQPTSIARGVVPLIGVRTVADDGKKEEKSMINFDLGTGKPTIASKRQLGSGKSFDEAEGAAAAGEK